MNQLQEITERLSVFGAYLIEHGHSDIGKKVWDFQAELEAEVYCGDNGGKNFLEVKA